MNKIALVVRTILFLDIFYFYLLIIFQVCLAACVSGDADADAFYGAYGYGLGYSGLGYSGLAGYPYAGYSGYSTPYLGYAGYGVSNGANTVGIHGAAPAAIPAALGGYAGAGR